MGQKKNEIGYLYTMDFWKILIVEDDAVIAQLLEHYVQAMGHTICGVSHNSEKALDLIHSQQPDLVLLDINIEGSKDGIDIAEVLEKQGRIPYIFITAFSDQLTLKRVQKVSPLAYIVKPFKEVDLRASITIGMSNYKRLIANTPLTLEYLNMNIPSPLSDQEFKILNEMSKGLTNSQIANQFDLSTNTVKWHSQNIYSKMGVKNRTSAAQFIAQL